VELSSDIEINDVTIENLRSLTPLGSTKCGSYMSGTDGGMPLQAATTNPGFGGTQVRGINLYAVSDATFNNVNVKNLISLNGPAYGIHGHGNLGECENVVFNNVEFQGLYSGIALDEDYSTDHWPNPRASSCAVEDTYGITFNDNVKGSCFYGHTGCNECSNYGLCKEIGSQSLVCISEVTFSTYDSQITISSDGSNPTITIEPISESSKNQNDKKSKNKVGKLSITQIKHNLTNKYSPITYSMILLFLVFMVFISYRLSPRYLKRKMGDQLTNLHHVNDNDKDNTNMTIMNTLHQKIQCYLWLFQ